MGVTDGAEGAVVVAVLVMQALQARSPGSVRLERR